jgi:S-formylglutathione hydrolase FrmB
MIEFIGINRSGSSVSKKSLLALILSLIFLSYFAWAKLASPSGDQKVHYTPSHKECFEGHGSVSWKYCIHTPASGPTNGEVAYLLHGRNLDENTWNDDTFYTAMIQEYWQRNKIAPPTVVTVSFGPMWLLTDKGQKEKSGLLPFFIENVIKEVESKTGQPRSRIVFGESMGGLNALVLGLKAGELFRKVASSCPAVYAMSPFAPMGDIQDFLKRTGADPKIVYSVIQFAKEFVQDEKEWNNFSPLQLINGANAKTSPEFYLSCGLYDTYGNYEGNELLAQKAATLGFKISWRPVYGGHCATDVVSLAEFLIK